MTHSISDAGTRGARGATAPPQYLADQWTLLQPGRADYPHLLLLEPPKFFTFRHHCDSAVSLRNFESYQFFNILPTKYLISQLQIRPPSEFGRSVNPIQTMRGRLCPSTDSPPGFKMLSTPLLVHTSGSNKDYTRELN